MEIVASKLCEIGGAATSPDQAREGHNRSGLALASLAHAHGDAVFSSFVRGWRNGKHRAETSLDRISHG